MLVTENGMAWKDTVLNEKVYDPIRADYFAHLSAAKAAIDQGSRLKVFAGLYWIILNGPLDTKSALDWLSTLKHRNEHPKHLFMTWRWR